MSLPRVLWLAEDKTLRMAPPEELNCLRYNPRRMETLTLPADTDLSLENVRGNGIELQVEVTSDQATQYGLKVCCSPDGREETAVFYDAVDRALKIDTTGSSLDQGPRSVEEGPLALARGKPLRLRVFVDRSVVEAFANDRQGVMRRIYPTGAESQGVSLFSRGGDAHVRSVEAWDMAPANPW
jgi:beta-fructofuranosidase